MKKQKFMKLSAFVSDPSLENSFSAPVSHSGEISVVFKEKNISIHGWDGSAWTTIYTWNNLDPQFKFENTYQNYYLKSLTGSEETMSVSFFSTDSIANSTPSLAGVDREVKFYDVEEVPVYRPSDVNKMLTIMSDGSLAWLLANESFVVGEEGGTSQPLVWSNLNGLEDLLGTTQGAILQFGSQLDNGILDLSSGIGTFIWTYPNMADLQQLVGAGGNISYEAWFNLNEDLAVNTSAGIYSNEYDPNIGFKTFISNIGGQYKLRFQAKLNVNGNQPLFDATGDVNVAAGEWHHVVTTVDSNNLAKIYFDGQYVAEVQTNGYRGMSGSESIFSLGHFNKNRNGQLRGKMDGVNVDNTTVWSDAEILAKYQAVAGGAPNEPVVVDVIENVWNHPNTTKYGNPTYENGILTLDGTSFMTHGDISEYMYTDYQTVNLWYKNDGGDRYGHMFGFGWIDGSDNNKDGSALTQWNSGRTDFDPVVGNGVSSNHTSTSDGQWHMVTVTWDNVSGMSKIYMDGVFKAERAFAPKSDPYRNGDDVYGLIIGTISKNGGLQGNQAYLGQFTNMTIENSVWDAAAVSAAYNAGV